VDSVLPEHPSAERSASIPRRINEGSRRNLLRGPEPPVSRFAPYERTVDPDAYRGRSDNMPNISAYLEQLEAPPARRRSSCVLKAAVSSTRPNFAGVPCTKILLAYASLAPRTATRVALLAGLRLLE
jgi:hypothetical protein